MTEARITLRLPMDLKKATDSYIKDRNVGLKKGRTSFNKLVVEGLRAIVGSGVQVPGEKVVAMVSVKPESTLMTVPEAKAALHSSWLSAEAAERIKAARTPAELAAAIPGLTGMEEDDGW